MNRCSLLTGLALLAACPSLPAIDRYVSLSGGHVPPFTDWAGAATNIQAAIDAALPGETVWVTNGIYNTGGKVKSGDLTNRVALDKALTVQSVNGPAETIIQGAWDSTTNGPTAVRCAWITNGATLRGFTLRQGATRITGAAETVRGGGVWGVSTNGSSVYNCVITNCSAMVSGGGACNVALRNSRLVACSVGTPLTGAGGGAYECDLENCWITRCSSGQGGGAYHSRLRNCTVTQNQSVGVDGASVVVNSIIFSNTPYDWWAGTITYSCTPILPTGAGNISADPQLLGDSLHLAATSPCRGQGSAISAGGVDIDGQPWNIAPSMGCDEWQPEPVAAVLPKPAAPGRVGELWLAGAQAAGDPQMTIRWLKNGEPLQENAKYAFVGTNLVIRAFDVADATAYQFVASNSYGVATSSVVRVALHCVDAANTAASTPFSSWVSAATSIQDAVNASSDWDVVIVTNGVFNSGGSKAPTMTLTNRVMINKPLVVLSANGPGSTAIEGAWDPAATNGPLAIRCVYAGTNVTLNGFTLRGGATLLKFSTLERSGGGFFSQDPSGMAVNCSIENNSAYYGGGASGGFLLNCRVQRNMATVGGGTQNTRVINSLIISNSAFLYAGFSGGDLANCTVTGNGGGSGGLVGSLRNCIVFDNPAGDLSGSTLVTVYNSCSPALSGNGNISVNPQLVDGMHIAATSPCRGAADPLYAVGTDLDGNAWTNPPSMGCFEVWEDLLIGPLTVGLNGARSELATGVTLPLYGAISGRANRVQWNFGDGVLRTNTGWQTSHAWTNSGDYIVTFTAYNNDHPAGVSATLPVHVVPLITPSITPGIWATNQFTLSIPTQWGVQYIVEQTTNLVPPVTWQTVTTRTGSDGLVQVTDSSATNNPRFYRVRVP